MNSNIVLQKGTIAFDGSGVQRSLAVSPFGQLLGWFVYVLRKHLRYKLFSWIR